MQANESLSEPALAEPRPPAPHNASDLPKHNTLSLVAAINNMRSTSTLVTLVVLVALASTASALGQTPNNVLAADELSLDGAPFCGGIDCPA
jgi:hypothetical protein